MESIFRPFYTGNKWGDSESASGPGSNLNRTAKLRTELPLVLAEVGARTLLDAPCGDCNWIKETDLGLDQYIGIDVVSDLISLFTNTYPLWRSNANIRTGDFRPLNLKLHPFNYPPSLRQIHEKLPEEQTQFFRKKLELWKLADLKA